MFKKPSSKMRGNGGFINGGELGLLVSLHQSQWEAGDTTAAGIPPARMIGFYFRLLMGGGGFSRWEAPKLEWPKRRKCKSRLRHPRLSPREGQPFSNIASKRT